MENNQEIQRLIPKILFSNFQFKVCDPVPNYFLDIIELNLLYEETSTEDLEINEENNDYVNLRFIRVITRLAKSTGVHIMDFDFYKANVNWRNFEMSENTTVEDLTRMVYDFHFTGIISEPFKVAILELLKFSTASLTEKGLEKLRQFVANKIPFISNEKRF